MKSRKTVIVIVIVTVAVVVIATRGLRVLRVERFILSEYTKGSQKVRFPIALPCCTFLLLMKQSILLLIRPLSKKFRELFNARGLRCQTRGAVVA